MARELTSRLLSSLPCYCLDVLKVIFQPRPETAVNVGQQLRDNLPALAVLLQEMKIGKLILSVLYRKDDLWEKEEYMGMLDDHMQLENPDDSEKPRERGYQVEYEWLDSEEARTYFRWG